jgi:plasmid rolling circle replication initiator protein Rep
MEQYISKSALVAEIERRKKYYENIQMIKPVYDSNIEDFNELLSFLNTQEMKEVDLDKEIKKYSMELAMKENNGDWLKDITATAKHFFELGMAVSNKTQKEEEYEI